MKRSNSFLFNIMFHKFQLGKLRVLINQTIKLNLILRSLKLKLIIDIKSYINYTYNILTMTIASIVEAVSGNPFIHRESRKLVTVLKGEMNRYAPFFSRRGTYTFCLSPYISIGFISGK